MRKLNAPSQNVNGETPEARKEKTNDRTAPAAHNISSNLLQGQSTPTFCHFFPKPLDFQKHTNCGSQYDPFRSLSHSQIFLRDGCNKENNVSDFAEFSPTSDKKVRQKTSSAGNIPTIRTDNFLHFSPGTNASSETMKKKLEALNKRSEQRKAKFKGSSSSQDRVDLALVEEKFLTSMESLRSVHGYDGIENDSTSMTNISYKHASNINNNSDNKPINATYIIHSKVQKAKTGGTFNNSTPIKMNVTEIVVDKKATHQVALKSWLNYLLDECDTVDSTELLIKNKKDADRYLMKLLTSNDNSLPKTSDTFVKQVGYRCFMATSKLNDMRTRFLMLYKNSNIPQDIAVAVKCGKIAIRMDRQIYSDIGLQAELLSLLLSFHPFYLRLGLETVLSVSIDLKSDSKSQLKIFASVISQKLFKDSKIISSRKYVQGRTKMLVTDQGAKALLQHFLTKICQFLFIVDKAWKDDVISKNYRCLFNRSSDYKSMSDVVMILSRELMTGISNLPKTLSRFGLSLDHKQGFFEEFQYCVVNLLKDLNDGVILGRVVEIVGNLQYNAIIRCLRNPGGDRLRKLGNVKTVIAFAKENGVLPKELNVDAEAIVEGNVDEIISLLWTFVDIQLGNVNKADDDWNSEISIICQQLESFFGLSYKIQSPLELANGNLFSLLWKKYYSFGTSFEFFDGASVLEQIANAAEYHFGIPSSMLTKWKCDCDERTLCLFTKIFISHIHYCYRFTCAAVTIQRAYRRYRTIRLYNTPGRLSELCSQAVCEEHQRRVKAAITIQKHVRAWLARKLCDKMRHERILQKESAACIIQKHVRAFLARKLYDKMRYERILKKESAACIIQKHVRAWLARKLCDKMRHERILKKESAACIIQKHVRAWVARKLYHKIRRERILQKQNEACIMQDHINGWLARKEYRKMQHEKVLPERENAACTIQKHVRAWLARKLYQKMQHKQVLQKQNAACIIQSHIRAWLARKEYRKLQHEKALQKRENAACTIQKHVRAWLARNSYCNIQYDRVLQKQKSAACTIQKYVRAWLARKLYRKMQHEKVLQGRESAVRVEYETNTDCVTKCKNVDKVQCMNMLRKLKKQHDRLRRKQRRLIRAVETEMKYSLLLERERVQRLKAATLIQAWWRGNYFRKNNVTIRRDLAVTRVNEQQTVSDRERVERMRPIMDRVINAMEELNSEHLYARFKATKVLQKFVGLSEQCALYVYENGGLECILDSLDGCNRGVGSTEVVIALCTIMWSVLKFQGIRGKLSEDRRQDVVKQCYHFMLAFHMAPSVVANLSQIIVALGGSKKQYEKAPYFVTELAKRFAKLSEDDERVIALHKLQNNVM